MARLRLPLSVVMAIAVVTGALLLGSSVLASPCPVGAFGSSNGVGGPRNPNGSDGPNSSDRASSNGIDNSGDSSRRADSFSGGREVDFASDFKWQSITNAELAGFGAIAGLFTVAIFYRVRHNRRLPPSEAALWSKHPFLEHPELVLALVPQEAWLSAFEAEFVPTRW
ncbi:MAG: hypothetical protein KME45_24030 [Stenomitos rutilans HA7619-LM2]|nr:hypothetical protein [Stenomitos rutilans HA7619-LM2]